MLRLVLILASAASIATAYNAEEAVKARTENLKRVCEKYKDPRRLEYDALYGKASAEKICVPNKVGTHAWRKFMVIQRWQDNQNGFERPDLPDRLAMFVRHPLERLLSSYLFSFRDSTTHSELTAKIKHMWLPLRKDKLTPDPDLGEDPNPKDNGGHETITWRQFVNFLTKCPEEFVDCRVWVSEGVAQHWGPFWQHCKVCANEFDFVLDMAHAEEDKDAMAVHAQFNSSIILDKMNETKSGSASDMEDKLKYFGQLTKQEIYDLYLKFKLDHELFGYTPDEYIAMGRDVDVDKSSVRTEL